MKTTNILIIVLLIALIAKDFFFESNNNVRIQERSTVIDTIRVQLPEQQLQFQQLPAPQLVYVPQRELETRTIERQPIYNYYNDSTTIIEQGDTAIAVNRSQDSITNKDGTFYLSALHEGQLYNFDLRYKLNQLQIKETITIPSLSFLSVTGGLRGGKERFDVPIGIDYKDRRGWGAYIRYSPINKEIEVGGSKRLWEIK